MTSAITANLQNNTDGIKVLFQYINTPSRGLSYLKPIVYYVPMW